MTLAIHRNISLDRIRRLSLLNLLLRVGIARGSKTYESVRLVRCLQATQDVIVICGSNCVTHMTELLLLIHTMTNEALQLVDCKLAA